MSFSEAKSCQKATFAKVGEASLLFSFYSSTTGGFGGVVWLAPFRYGIESVSVVIASSTFFICRASERFDGFFIPAFRQTRPINS